MIELKNKIVNRECVVGTMLSEFYTPNIIRLIKCIGYEFVFIDCEHGYFDLSQVANLAAVGKGFGIGVIVRVPSVQREFITKVLDIGVDGLLLPQIDNVELAKQAVYYAKYCPEGKRGLSTTRAHTDYNPPSVAEYVKKANKENSIIKLTRLYHKTKKELKKVKINKPKDTLKVGIIGELYTAMEPFATYDLEKLLASYNIEIKRFTNLSYLLWQKKLMPWFMKFKIRKYCKYTLGADGLDNVYRVYWLKKHKYDGIIHTKPTGCTPEIGAMPIIMNIAKDNNMPIIFLSFDEQTGVEGLNTRIEAFYDLLKIKKEEENGSKSRN